MFNNKNVGVAQLENTRNGKDTDHKSNDEEFLNIFKKNTISGKKIFIIV